MTFTNDYCPVLGAIIDATINHHATISVEHGFEGYEFLVRMLGCECRIDTQDPTKAGDELISFINATLEEVDG
jgi:hypothetical protein